MSHFASFRTLHVVILKESFAVILSETKDLKGSQDTLRD
jgi:hypothetical protein